MNRDRFPGLSDGWARLDGAAGSQVLDSVIEAMSDFMRSGSMANHGGAFKHALATDELVASTRSACATLLGGDPHKINPLQPADQARTISIDFLNFSPKIKRISDAQKQQLMDSGRKGVQAFLHR